MKKVSRYIGAAAVAGLAATLTACTSTQHLNSSTDAGAPPSGSIKPGGSVTISDEGGQTWACQFNPFNDNYQALSLGTVYEPLVFQDILNNQAQTPMLASSYTWNANKTSIVFDVRQGVRWSDGQPFTAEDVAFTFNLLKQHPALDLYSLWSAAGLESATASGDTATLTFSQNAQAYFYNFADQIGIVPQHIWGDASVVGRTPETWADSTPVGTGPYEISPCSPNNIQYTANPHYWMPDEPHIQKVEFPAYLSNDPANEDLASGKDQWGNQFIPSIQSFYLTRSVYNHTWSPPVTNVDLFPNLAQGPTTNLKVRQAISYALDRAKISAIGEDGEEPPANQTAVISPTFSQYEDTAALSASGFGSQNVTKATQLMSEAGYSTSHPLTLTVITVTGYTDWDADLAVVKSELAPIGINLVVDDLAGNTYTTQLNDGDFQLAFDVEAGGPTPYTELRQELLSQNSAPIGQAASTNFERYDNPAVDALFKDYAVADPARQIADIKKISDHILQDVPLIPVVESVDWFQYNDSDIKGWPTPQTPYAQPGPAIAPDIEQVLLHLYSKAAQ